MRRSARRSARVRPRSRTASPRLRPAPSATLLLHPDVLRTVACAAVSAGELETGGPLIGTVQSSWNGGHGAPSQIVSILGTVAPGPASRASAGWVSLGRRADGERAASAIRWWRDVTGLDLVHLGDWHKHDVRLPEPSAGDRATAKEMVARATGPLWLVAIAVGHSSEKGDVAAEENCAVVARTVTDCEQLRFHRANAVLGLKAMPVKIDGDALPALPPLPWHVADSARFAAECRLLAAAGFAVAIEPSDSRSRPGLLLRLRSDARAGLTIVTGPGYPEEPPLARDNAGKRVKPNGPWSSGRYLVDLVP